MKQAIILIGLLGLISSCGAPKNSKVSASSGYWEQYFAEAFQDLASYKAGTKKVTLDGKMEEHSIELDSAAWAQELSFFTKNNMDKPSWQGWFAIDSSTIQDTLIIQYERLKDKIPVQHALIKKLNGQVIYYERFLERSNPISGLQRRLIFEYPYRVEIDNREQLLFLSDHHLNIVYEWD